MARARSNSFVKGAEFRPSKKRKPLPPCAYCGAATAPYFVDDDETGMPVRACGDCAFIVETTGARPNGRSNGRKWKKRVPNGTWARRNSSYRKGVVLLWEHQSGKRGNVLGLPGVGEMTFHAPRDTKADVGYWITALRRGNGSPKILLLDQDGNELSPEPYIEAYRASPGRLAAPLPARTTRKLR